MPKSRKAGAASPEIVGLKPAGEPSAFVDTRLIYCGDNLEQLKKLPDACVDLIYIDPPFNSNRNSVGRPDIDKFQAAMMRTRRKKGFFVGFDFSRDALTEIDAFF